MVLSASVSEAAANTVTGFVCAIAVCDESAHAHARADATNRRTDFISRQPQRKRCAHYVTQQTSSPGARGLTSIDEGRGGWSFRPNRNRKTAKGRMRVS